MYARCTPYVLQVPPRLIKHYSTTTTYVRSQHCDEGGLVGGNHLHDTIHYAYRPACMSRTLALMRTVESIDHSLVSTVGHMPTTKFHDHSEWEAPTDRSTRMLCASQCRPILLTNIPLNPTTQHSPRRAPHQPYRHFIGLH